MKIQLKDIAVIKRGKTGKKTNIKTRVTVPCIYTDNLCYGTLSGNHYYKITDTPEKEIKASRGDIIINRQYTENNYIPVYSVVNNDFINHTIDSNTYIIKPFQGVNPLLIAAYFSMEKGNKALISIIKKYNTTSNTNGIININDLRNLFIDIPEKGSIEEIKRIKAYSNKLNIVKTFLADMKKQDIELYNL